MEIKDVLSVTQAAKIAGRHPSTLRHAILEGELKAHKLSDRVVVIHRKDLDAWLKDGRWKEGSKGRPPNSVRGTKSKRVEKPADSDE